jgi:hypothetical protein
MLGDHRPKGTGSSSANNSSHGANGFGSHSPKAVSADGSSATQQPNSPDIQRFECNTLQGQQMVLPNGTHHGAPDVEREGSAACTPVGRQAGSVKQPNQADGETHSLDQPQMPPPPQARQQPAAGTEPCRPPAARSPLSLQPQPSHQGRTRHASLELQLLHGSSYCRAALWRQQASAWLSIACC